MTLTIKIIHAATNLCLLASSSSSLRMASLASAATETFVTSSVPSVLSLRSLCNYNRYDMMSVYEMKYVYCAV